MRAAQLLTWSFDGHFFLFTSESTLCIPACSHDDISRKQPHGQPTQQHLSFLPSHVIDAWQILPARTRSASVPALMINLHQKVVPR
jgi:hypothetical protein